MVSGTLSGICFVALTQIATRDKVPGTLHYAVLCFAIAIPCMAAYCLYPPTFQRKGGMWSFAYSLFHLFYLVVLLVTFIGLALLFFSISLLAGFVFCVGFLGAYRIIATGSSNEAGIEGFK